MVTKLIIARETQSTSVPSPQRGRGARGEGASTGELILRGSKPSSSARFRMLIHSNGFPLTPNPSPALGRGEPNPACGRSEHVHTGLVTLIREIQ